MDGLKISLNLPIPGSEFVVSLHLWLGITLFIVSILHVLFHALSQSHTGVLFVCKEQCISGNDQSQPVIIQTSNRFSCLFAYVLLISTQAIILLLLLVLG